MSKEKTNIASAESRIMFALGKQEALLKAILSKICANPKPQDSIPEKLIRYAKQSSEMAQSIASAIPYILNWGTWIGSAILVWWKWLLPYVRSFVGF